MPSRSHHKSVPRSIEKLTTSLSPTGSTLSVTRQVLGTSANTEESTSSSWENTANFRSLRKSGEILPVNPFTHESWTGSCVPPRMRRRSFSEDGSSVVEEVDFLGGWTYIPSLQTVPPSLVGQAKARVVNRAKGQEWSAPLFLKELPETARMVYARANQIVQMALALRRGNVAAFALMAARPPSVSQQRRFHRRYGVDPQKTAADAWLEWNYGWSPFVADVYDAMATLHDLASGPRTSTLRVVATARRSLVEHYADTAIYGADNAQIRGDITLVHDWSARFTWLCRPKSGDIPGKLGLLNPAELVWQALPLSFVVDWFLPIGDYLGTFDAGLRFTHIAASQGLRSSVRSVVNPKRVTGYHSFTGGQSSCTRVKVERKSTGMPVMDLSEFGVQIPDSVGQAVSAIALMRQRFPFR